jgi:hypothetical protein
LLKPFNIIYPTKIQSVIDPYTGAPRYIEAKTSGEIMLAKLGYHQVYRTEKSPSGVRIFEKEKAMCIESIAFEKYETGISFSKSEITRNNKPYSEPPRPELVQPKELEAII